MVKMSMECLLNSNNNDNQKKELPKEYQLTLTEKILLHGIIDLVKKYLIDLETDIDLFEDEKFRLLGVINDLRELLENVEGLYSKK